MKELGIGIIAVIMVCVLIFIFTYLLSLTRFIHEDAPEIILSIPFVALVAFLVGKFIYWLFIEPFRKKNRGK